MTTAKHSPGGAADLDTLFALAVGQQRAGRLDEAAAAYREILALRPDLAEPHNNLGTVLCQQGRLDEALPHFEQAIALKPNFADAHNNSGNLLQQLGRLDLAAAAYRQVAALKPNDAAAHTTLANLLRKQGQPQQAETHYRQALALRPNFAEGHNNLGVVLAEQERFDEAAAHYRQALAIQPDFLSALNNLGNALRKQRRLDEAVALYRQALALDPNYPEAHCNLGTTLREQGKVDEAQARYEQAIALRPDFAEAYDKLGCLLRDEHKMTEARQTFERLAAIQPDPPYAQFGLAICDLLEGNYERGWRGYESRLRLRPPGLRPRIGLPRWTGQDLAGRSLLVVAEQGLGDTLQFIRYVRALKALGPRIWLAVQPALGRLLASYRDVDELFLLGSTDVWPQADFYLRLLSAPGALHTDASSIPCEIPYLWAEPELIERWREELAQVEGFKIGVAWHAGHENRAYLWRSIPLANFAPLARLPGVQLISLQKGSGSEQSGTAGVSILDFSSRLDEAAGPFMDTAAVIRNLDLVVTIDTSIAHLAGALGAPVFVALPVHNEWRWLHDREDSPWYPTLRLFRQKTLGQWSDVFERITAAVAARLAGAPSLKAPSG